MSVVAYQYEQKGKQYSYNKNWKMYCNLFHNKHYRIPEEWDAFISEIPLEILWKSIMIENEILFQEKFS